LEFGIFFLQGCCGVIKDVAHTLLALQSDHQIGKRNMLDKPIAITQTAESTTM